MAESATKPRLWGEWTTAFYGSGTTIVTLKGRPHKPHLYVYGDVSIDDSRYRRGRYQMCHELCDFMNGGDRPAWLDDFERQSETYSESLSGAKIFATGPCVDADPPKLHWVQDESWDAQCDRARLLDALFL